MKRGWKALSWTSIVSLSFLLLLGSRFPLPAADKVIAYEVPAGTFGNQDVGGIALGMDFEVITDIGITRLGVFDSGSDGLFLPLTASIWDRGQVLGDVPAQLDFIEFTPEDPGDLIGGSRFKELQLDLPAGFRGSIVVGGYGAAEQNGNTFGNFSNPLNQTLNDGGCAILFTGGGRFGGDPVSFPGTADGGPPDRYLAGTFEFEPLETLPPTQEGVPYIAYNVPEGTLGNQNANVALGMDFEVRASPGVQVTRLGVFDSGSDGIMTPLTARIYNRDSLEDLAHLDFTTEEPGDLVEGSVFKDLPAPLFLPQGFKGTIVGEGYNDLEMNGNQGVGPIEGLTLDGAGCAIAFVGSSRYAGAVGIFPTTGDSGPPNRYAAGTFVFEFDDAVVPAPNAPTNVTALPGNGKVDLSWAAATAGVPATKYRVFRGASAGGAFTQIAEVAGTSHTDTPLNNDVNVCYHVRTVSAAGVESFNSATRCAVPTGPQPEGRFIAYEVPQGTPGNQAFGGALGHDFDVLSDIRVFRLGVFDDGSDGLNVPIAARIFDRDTLEELALVEFTPEESGVLIGGSHFKELDDPLDLSEGFHGTMVASGYGGTERNGNQGVGPVAGLTTDDGGCRISFVGSARFGNDPTTFPGTPDGGPPNRYAAGTFEFAPLGPAFVPAPVNLAAVQEETRIDLTWADRACASAPEKYRVLRSANGAAFAEVAQVTERSYTDSAVAAGTDYCYVVRAVSGALESEDSASACATLGRFIAYVVPSGTVGARTDGVPLGMDFDVKLDLQVTRLGAFDSGSDGLGAPITVRIYNRETEEEMASLDFTPAAPGTLLNGSRFKTLSTPLNLGAGFLGTIVAEGYGVDEPAGDGGAWSTNPGPCSLFFIGTGRSDLLGGGILALPNNAGRPDQYAAGTFEFVPEELGTPHGAIAYVIPEGTIGNQEHTGSLGHDFNVNVDIQVTRLGVFDSGSDGLTRTITAQIYDRDSQAVMAELVFTPEDPGELVEGSRFKELETPLSLPAGFHGVSSAGGYGPGEQNGNSFSAAAGVPWTVDDGGCAITFVGNGRFGPAPAGFSANVDGGPVNRYAGPTFEFETGGQPEVTFTRGDADQNGTLQLTDAVQILGFLFLGQQTEVPKCMDAADTDDNGSLQLTDAVRILGFLFLGGTAPAAPFGACGKDPTTEDALDCISFAACP